MMKSTANIEEVVSYEIDIRKERPVWIKLAFLYVLSWIAIYYQLPAGISIAVFVLLFLVQFSSYYVASAIFLMAFLAPFMDNLLEGAVRGMDSHRVLFIPFFIYSLWQKKLRPLPIDNYTLSLILISLVSLQLTSAFQILYRGMPLSAGEPGWDVLALAYDNFTILAFLYFVFTRLPLDRINQLLTLFMIITVFASFSVVQLSLENKDLLYNPDSSGVLWRNPFFGHKNEWSIIFVFVLLIAIVKSFRNAKHKTIYYVIMAVIMLAISFSLSRQAYVWTVLAFLMVAFFARSAKIVGYIMIVLVALMLLQPDFLFNRMESMVNARNKEEFQQLNSKVGDRAVQQVVENFTFVPQVLHNQWEYNYSEGFWNGFLHQQGIIGLFFTFYLYFHLFKRFHFFYTHRNSLLTSYGIMGMVTIVLMFLGNVNRRHTHLMHYKGDIGPIGLLLMFLLLLTELTYYHIKHINHQQASDKLVTVS